LSNYEIGVSIPSPDDVALIAKATETSPGWIMFGLGPIGDKRDIQAIRHQNFLGMVQQAKEQRKLNELPKVLGISRKKIDDHCSDPFFTIDTRLARKCDQFLSKKAKWFDEQHTENDPICLAFPKPLRMLMQIYSDISSENRDKLIKFAELLHKEPESKAK